jgi:formate hydrogenlyase subunit 3/multisubunit Na+/H+ antiporter MnhD subunit
VIVSTVLVLGIVFTANGEILLMRISSRLYLRFAVDNLSIFFLLLISAVW